jgi:hypothetical protein
MDGGKKMSHPVSSVQWPIDLFSCHKGDITNTPADFSEADYEMIVDHIISVYEAEFSQDPLTAARFGACLVRYTGHDFMDFLIQPDGTTIGGADGCIDMFASQNIGIELCLTKFNILDAYQRVCDRASLADFSVIISEAIQGRLATDYNKDDKFNPDYLLGKFKRNFKFGRKTA